MILSLRQRHRRIMLVLLILLPVVLVVTLRARRPAPVMRALPAWTSGGTL